jgi:lactose/cellobiose-specific phosphotransferase system IIC component
MIPLIIIKCFALMMIDLPISAYQSFLHTPTAAFFLDGATDAMSVIDGYFALLMTVSISWSYGREKDVQSVQTILFPLLASVCFLILIGFHTESFQPVYMTHEGVLSCLIAVFAAGAIYFWLLKQFHIGYDHTHYKIDTQLHDIVYSIIPLFSVMLLFILAQQVILYLTGGACLQLELVNMMNSFFHLFAAIPLLSTAFFLLMVQCLWFLGINGNNILYDINDNYFSALSQENMIAAASGLVPPNIITSNFTSPYLMIGGSGDVLGLVLALFVFSSSRGSRTIAKLGVLPSVFNISEIVSFGVPIVCNPVFLVPFLTAPLLNLIIAYTATALQFVPIPINEVNWTTPLFISGYITTGAFSGSVLQLVLVLADFLLYAPFVRLSDEQREFRFMEAVRSLERYYQKLEGIHEQLRLEDLSDVQHGIVDLLMNDLAEALEDRQLFMVYQPQVDSHGHFLGAEALLRWQHSTAGFIYPPLIIALAKKAGILPDLERFIFNEACHTIAELDRQLDTPFKISVNITGDSLKYDGLEELLETAVDAAAIDPARLWIEITEQDAIDTTTDALETLKRIRTAGHHLLIDDFGMGHTSLAYLKTNLFDIIKLDGSITRNVLQDGNNQKIISSLILLSRTMKLKVIAEYVDNVPQRDKLRLLGCDAFQGYLYSQPILPDDLSAFCMGNH